MAAMHPQKRQRIDSGYNVAYQIPAGCTVAAPTFATQNAAITQQRAIHPNDLWTTISSLPESTIRETLFHATMGSMTHSQMMFNMFDMHHQRMHAEAETAAAARKAEEARIKREQKRVVSFERDVQQIEEWLHDDHPSHTNKKNFPAAENLFEKKLLPRIVKIKEKGTSEHARFGTKCNALHALNGIAKAVCKRQKGGVGCEIISWFEREDEEISDGMLAVVESMRRDEVGKARDELVEGVALGLEIQRVWNMGKLSQRGTAFEGLETVLEAMGVHC